jgi:hypothetical protein
MFISGEEALSYIQKPLCQLLCKTISHIRPDYRNVNINIYRVDRNNFRDGFRSIGRNQYRFSQIEITEVNDNPSGSNGNGWGG